MSSQEVSSRELRSFQVDLNARRELNIKYWIGRILFEEVRFDRLVLPGYGVNLPDLSVRVRAIFSNKRYSL